MSGYLSSQWSSFADAQLAASAALLGLVFVGLSINLRDIVGSRPLVNRGAEAVILLGSVVVMSTAVSIPDQQHGVLGGELVLVAAGLAACVSVFQRGLAATIASSPSAAGPSRASVALRRVFGMGAPALAGIAGISLIVQAGGGLYWWPAAVVVAYAGALTDAWVLLVEILR